MLSRLTTSVIVLVQCSQWKLPLGETNQTIVMMSKLFGWLMTGNISCLLCMLNGSVDMKKEPSEHWTMTWVVFQTVPTRIVMLICSLLRKRRQRVLVLDNV
jgi:hypothetical protein